LKGQNQLYFWNNHMINVRVLPTKLEHIDDIMVVETLSFKIPWSRKSLTDDITRNELAVYFSAAVEDKIIGYAGMWKVIDEGQITNIAVHPHYRGNGVGSELLKSLIEAAKSKSITRMTLEVRKTNTAAQGLYLKYGFNVEGCRKAYYADNGEDAIIMWKNII
jgi:ribosomal-protein-alanine N-acetyltransferase